MSKIALVFLDHAFDDIGDAASPRFVRIAAQVDRFVQQYGAGFRIFNLNVDIDNQIAHLLDPANQDPIGLQRASYVKLATIAFT